MNVLHAQAPCRMRRPGPAVVLYDRTQSSTLELARHHSGVLSERGGGNLQALQGAEELPDTASGQRVPSQLPDPAQGLMTFSDAKKMSVRFGQSQVSQERHIHLWLRAVTTKIMKKAMTTTMKTKNYQKEKKSWWPNYSHS